MPIHIVTGAEHRPGTNGTVLGATGGAIAEIAYGATAGASQLAFRDSNGDLPVRATVASGDFAVGKTECGSIGTQQATSYVNSVKGAASGLASLNGSSLVVEDPANADAAATASKIAKRTANAAIVESVTAGITASVTQTQGQGPLTSEINEVSTCANENDTVTLPAAAAGLKCLVINNGAQTMKVFPASGDDLGAGVNNSTTIATTKWKYWKAWNTTTWILVAAAS